MRKYPVIFILLFPAVSNGQQYDRNSNCGTDTIPVDYVHRMTGERIKYKAFECTQVSKLGLRLDIGFNTHSYSGNTKKWLGNHNGALFGITIAYKNFNLGAKFNLGTVRPTSELVLNGDTIPRNAAVNPNKIDFDLGYSIDFKHNFSIEPFIGLTRNVFYVINEKELNKEFNVPRFYGLVTGLTLNKYFQLKEFRFLSVFVKYGYGFTNFKRINSQLGAGYTNLAAGLSYKLFYRRNFLKRIK